MEIKIIAWHPSADKIIKENKLDELFETDNLSDVLLLLSRLGLNTIFPKDFEKNHELYVDTKYFQQR